MDFAVEMSTTRGRQTRRRRIVDELLGEHPPLLEISIPEIQDDALTSWVRGGDALNRNVEAVLPMLSKSAYASRAAYGYCRCRETLEYVRQVTDHYAAYTRVAHRAAPESWTARPATTP